MLLTLGTAADRFIVIGVPLLILSFLRRNRRKEGGLSRHVVQVRYGLFYGSYTLDRYYWEIVLIVRKVSIVSIKCVRQ